MAEIARSGEGFLGRLNRWFTNLAEAAETTETDVLARRIIALEREVALLRNRMEIPVAPVPRGAARDGIDG